MINCHRSFTSFSFFCFSFVKEKMDGQNYGEASALLIAAQQKAEELYMDSDGE